MKSDAQLELLTMEALAKLAGCSVRKVQRYEEEGLLVASRVISRGRRSERLYAHTAVVHVRRIRSFEQIGVNLAGVDVILRLLERLAERETES